MQRHIPGVITPQIEHEEMAARAHQVHLEHARATSMHPAMQAWRERVAAKRQQDAVDQTFDDIAWHETNQPLPGL